MKKARIISLLLCVSLICISILPLASCANGSTSSTKTLYVYNWGEYMSDGSEGCPDVNEDFEEWYFKTYGERVEVNMSTYSSNEDMYAKITSGAVQYDIIVPSDYMIERLIKENELLPLDYSNIPNIQNLLPEFFGSEAIYDYYDNGNVYSVPYLYGMIGVIYNTTMVKEDDPDIGSWSLMWDDDYKNNILQFNNSRDAFGTAQYYLGIDVNSDNEKDWERALEKLREQKDFVQGYVMDEIYNKMENGSAAISSYYAGDFLTMYENNEDLEFFYPKEGTNLYIDAMCIPKGAQNKLIAERYINFMLSEEPAVANAEYTYYASPTRLVVENEEYIEYMNDIKEGAFELMYNTDVKFTPYKNLDNDKLILLNNLWEDLKSDVRIDPLIYVVCGGVIFMLTFFGIYVFFRNRKRRKYQNSL